MAGNPLEAEPGETIPLICMWIGQVPAHATSNLPCDSNVVKAVIAVEDVDAALRPKVSYLNRRSCRPQVAKHPTFTFPAIRTPLCVVDFPEEAVAAD